MRTTPQPAATSGVRRALVYGSMGNGTAVHLTGVMLAMEGNVHLKQVPYRTAAQMRSDVIGGQFDGWVAMVALAGTPEQTGQFFRTELDKHSVLAKRGGAKLD